ncbi:MAG: SGNH/GDSL hydrolase family protein [Planctomycetota bacterium]|nr:SGNH/GDSL hydrolase family protein [Planctomycetota bacterium]
MEKSPFVVVVWGDSIAAAGWPAMAETTHNVSMNVGRSIKVINEAQGGMPAALARTQFDQRVARHSCDLVVIQFGFNDLRYDGSRDGLPLSTPEEFAGHLRDMATRCRTECSAKVLLLGNHRARRPHIMPTGKLYDHARAAYNQVTQSVASELGLPYIDMSQAILTPGISYSEYVNEDGVHLSPLGLHAYAAVVGSAIGQIVRGEPVVLVSTDGP